MPPKRTPGAVRDDEAGAETEGRSDGTQISMSEEMLQTLVSSITRSQLEANRLLIEGILSERAQTSSPRTDTPNQPQLAGNFAKCTARFDGRSKDADELEAFIDAIEVYRECTGVNDEHALRGLPMLLVGDAAVWWQGVKSSVTSWVDALQRLRGMFGVPRPGYKVFRDIFTMDQRNDRADVFICKVRALIAKLPYVVPEEMQLDIVYGLLDYKLRKRVPRDTVDGLEHLIERVRLVEDTLAEVSSLSIPSSNACNSNNNLSSINRSTARVSASPSAVNPACAANPIRTVGDTPNVSKSGDTDNTNLRDVYCYNNPRIVNTTHCSSEGQTRIRPKCTFCKVFGHTIENCRKRSMRDSGSDNNTQLRCYGCGQLGVVRSKCENCRSGPSSKELDFQTTHVLEDDDPRPTVEIQVVKRRGAAILDTGATHSIAGSRLYQRLAESGIEFRELVRSIGLADGSHEPRRTLECNTEVILHGRSIPTTFIILPDSQTRTLLGRDFITDAGILLDLPQSSWSFRDSPRHWHPFITVPQSPAAHNIDLVNVQAEGLLLRKDEGTKLRLDQKIRLNTFLVQRADRFAKAGPPTEYATHRIRVEERQEPTASPPYRLSQNKKEILDEELQKLLQADITEECEFLLAANVVRVSNKDGGERLCIDHRKLNAVTELDRYPLPKINVIADTQSRPACCDKTLGPACEVCFVTINLPHRSPTDVCDNQLTDDPFRGRSWSDDGYVISDRMLFEANEVQKNQAIQKRYADEGRRPAPEYSTGDLVLLKSQGSNDTTCGQTPKFIPRRDGPYRVREAASSTTYILERISTGEVLGRYHVSQLTPFVGDVVPPPMNEKRRRGRPKRYLD